jgi:hypothetical protein
MEYRNLKGKYNRYLEDFKKFVYLKEEVQAWAINTTNMMELQCKIK